MSQQLRSRGRGAAAPRGKRASSNNNPTSSAGSVPTSTAGGGSPAASGTLTFVSEMVTPSLPDGLPSLGDVAAACDGCPHDDLVWLPGLLVMAAHLTIACVLRPVTALAAGDAPPNVGEYLACAACIIKSLLEIVLKLRKQQEAPPEQQQAPVCGHDDILQAALHLRSEVYHAAVRHCISVPVCAWERGIPGRPSNDEVVRRTSIYWADDKGGAPVFPAAEGVPAPVTAVLKKLQEAAAEKAGPARSASSTGPQTPSVGSALKGPKHYVSPHLRHDALGMSSVLPCELSQGPIDSVRAPLQALKAIEFSLELSADDRALFDAEKWKAHVFDRTADAAARRIAEALGELAELSAPEPRALPPNKAPEEKSPPSGSGAPSCNNPEDTGSTTPAEGEGGGATDALGKLEKVAPPPQPVPCNDPEDTGGNTPAEGEGNGATDALGKLEKVAPPPQPGAPPPKAVPCNDPEDTGGNTPAEGEGGGAEDTNVKAADMEARLVALLAANKAEMAAKMEAEMEAKISAQMEQMKMDMEAEKERNKAEMAAGRERNKADMEQMKMEMERLKVKVNAQDKAALVAKVNAAKTTYCDALLKTIRFPMTLLELLRAVFIDSMNRGEDAPSAGPHFKTQIPGRCSLRAALLAGWAASTCELREPVSFKMLDETMAKMRLQLDSGVASLERERTSRRYDELFKIAHMIDGRCLKCRKEGQCATQNGHPICGEDKGKGKASLPTIEKKAHIIPHAAALSSETALLLHRVDGASRCGGCDLAHYLASAHNLLRMSSCFEECFDNGTLVLVKVGPPELQCYQVTSTPSSKNTEVVFGEDLQMHDLLSHNQATKAPLLLSCIDGLVVNLARPTFVFNRRDKLVFVPHVSHRYLDLHARAHNPVLQDAPLVAHKYTLSAQALELNRTQHRYMEGLDEITIEAWLDELAPQPRTPTATATAPNSTS